MQSDNLLIGCAPTDIEPMISEFAVDLTNRSATDIRLVLFYPL